MKQADPAGDRISGPIFIMVAIALAYAGLLCAAALPEISVWVAVAA